MQAREASRCGRSTTRPARSSALYVRDAFQGAGVERTLASELIALARHAGYTRLRLDTHSTMTPAQNLYRSLGFAEIPAY